MTTDEPTRLDLGVAGKAAGILDDISQPDGTISSELLTRLKGLPAMLRVSGLPATLAFFAAKSGTDGLGAAYGKVSRHLQATTREAVSAADDGDRIVQLIAKLTQAPVGEQAMAFATVDALAMWLRRLSEAVAKEQQKQKQKEKEKKEKKEKRRSQDGPGDDGESSPGGDSGA